MYYKKDNNRCSVLNTLIHEDLGNISIFAILFNIKTIEN